MNFEPQKFFIGLIDFFSVLLPGAVLTYLLKDPLGNWVLGEEAYCRLADAQAALVFLFSSYLLGHFIFLLGSQIDELYDALQTTSPQEQIARLGRGKKLPWALTILAARLTGRWFDKRVDPALSQALRIKKHYLEPLGAAAAVNAFQ